MSLNNIKTLLQQQNISWSKLEGKLKEANADQATLDHAKTIFNNLDKNNDGSISSNEWDKADTALRELDKDQNSSISDNEIESSEQTNMFKAFGAKVTNTFVNAMNSAGGEKINSPQSPDIDGISATGGGAIEDDQPPQNNPGLDKSKYEFDEDGNLLTYAKEGETFKQTAERLGFKPGTPEYEELVKSNPADAKRNWCMVGEPIKVPQSIQDKVVQENLLNKNEVQAEIDKYKSGHPAPMPKASNTPAPSRPSGPRRASTPEKPNGGSSVNKSNYPKGVQDRIANLKKSGDTFEIKRDKAGNYIISISDGPYLKKTAMGNITIIYDSAGNMVSQTNKYNNGKIIETTYKGGKKSTVKANAAPQNYQNMAAQIKKKYGGNVRVEYDAKSKKYVMVQTNIPKSNIKEKRIVVDAKAWQEKMTSGQAAKKGAEDAWNTFKLTSPSSWKKAYNAAMRNKDSSIKLEDHFLSETTTYKNGKITQGIYKEGKVRKQKTIKEGAKTAAPTGAAAANSASAVKDRDKLHSATDISFSMPANAPKNAVTFANSLVDNKAKLMRQLNIDSDTYNMLAQTAIGIARQETNFGETTGRQVLKDIARYPNDSIAMQQHFWGMENTSAVSDWSQGMTQLKFTLHMKDPIVKKNMEALGITNELQLKNPSTSAIATMVVLAKLNQEIDSPDYQAGIKTAQGTEVRLNGYEFDPKTNASKKTADGSTKPWKNNITRQDVLCAFWNGGDRASVKNGTFKPAVSTYSNNVRRYTQQYKLNESKASRNAAVEKEEAIRPMKTDGNNGDIGGVVFMPAMYTDKAKHMNTITEINQLKDILTKKGIDPNLRNMLISALRNGELGFDFGLKRSEIEALTNSDIKLILKHLDKAKKTVNADSSVNTSDGISAQEARTMRSKYASSIGSNENSFRKEYLNNHSRTFNTSANNPKVLRETSTNRGSANYVSGNGERRGYKHEKAKGVNQNTSRGRISQQANILAGAAHNIVMQNPNNTSNGECLTGVKNAMKNAGIDVSSMTKYGSTPRFVKNWFAAHPEMFTPVEYVSTGSGTARAINASDLSSLPAGYIVIWTPGAGYDSQAGHIAITNGNGQGYSDATDNLGWGSYNNNKTDSGKGEHGTFVVYKLSDNWEVGTDGKLRLKS